MAHKYKSGVSDYFILSKDGKSFICKCKAKDDIEEKCGEKIKKKTFTELAAASSQQVKQVELTSKKD